MSSNSVASQFKEEQESPMNKIIKILIKNKFILAILLLGIFLRTHKPLEMFMYSHDQDLASWVIRDVLENHHIRLIGQETSSKGVFIGMGYYYLLIPFYLIFNMNPIGGLVLSTLFSTLTILSYYFIFTKIFNKKVGLIGALIYASSIYTVLTDRESVPTVPVMLWSVWFLYAQYLILKNKQLKGFLLSALLLGLVWHINLGLVILAPLPVISFLLSKKKLNIKAFIYAFMLLIFTSLPLIAFETRHNFSQTKAIFTSLQAKEVIATSRLEKFDRVMQLNVKNTNRLLGIDNFNIPKAYSFYGLLLAFTYLVYKKIINYKFAIISVYWLGIYTLFFTFNSINTSEYYLNGMIVIWIMIAANFAQKKFVFPILAVFVLLNIHTFLNLPANKSGYLYRRAIISEIKADATIHNYPCVSISYITEPGYDFGYRYLFKLEQMHVNRPDSLSPVYTIVYPLSLVDGNIDRSFGALGLIYPDYESYDLDEVNITCQGENSNLTDPLFGFTR